MVLSMWFCGIPRLEDFFELGNAGTGRGQEVIEVAVVAAVELDDRVPVGESAGQADGAHRRLGPGVDETDQLDGRHLRRNVPGDLDFFAGRGTETGPFFQCPFGA